ncbi:MULTISPECIES: aminotransferase class I/II-fold pyridoxal phosphate-dependent enzyme [Streptomyces]|uniref:Aminotransferase class I/II-fold pyridoxal phosphate-dependent enzyme n=1 Tax=Streptomyces koelreuteriae TaxID=2838015 RepID=A0ABX8G2S9_9ACTN|nr:MULTISPECIES: aminotransferase class I/II-fold pyridoxal phosphate-dependent enzyme [Streptomyces]QWB27835.1 aminotransferase class I/II-fold pyridoxal phosphate-dependent enzyme [Streptomyces koelreuteriae]UUA10941.1 aminotransferase class I/II-fold pyridoxal phosphate-dependent enzyme [Streptomyces koelreuteriae]UUA18547.1 aminotransferase class I/II-fold pyridoxal phosphate-dependent enzyme [Streptomyces sp. CRCS-T-1]
MSTLPARPLTTAYIALVAVATLVYLTVPAARPALWAAIGLAGVTAVLTGTRLHRPAHRWPWWALAGGLLTFIAGDTYYNVMEEYFDASNPFPSPADACYLATYPLFAIGLSGLVRHRWADRDLPSLLDALIITAGLALPVWVYLVQPLTVVEGLTWQQRAISIAYPLGDVLVLALLARLLTPSRVTGPHRAVTLLVAGTVTLLGFDIAYGILQLNDLWRTGTLLDTGWIVFYTAWGLAALHPSMVELTAAVPQRESLLPPPRRLVVLTVATLIAPGILLYEGLRNETRDAAVIAVFSGVLFLLVILRLTGMVVAHRRAVTRELALRGAAASLVSAFRQEEVDRSCRTAVDRLLGPDVPHRTVLLPAEGDPDLGAHGTRLVTTAALEPGIAAGLDGLPSVLVCPMTQPDRPAGAVPGVLLVAAPERQLTETSGSLEILASHAGLAMERVSLRQEVVARENEAYFRTLVRNTSDVILILEADDTIRYASPSALSVLGTGDLVGVPLPELVAPVDRKRAARELAAVRESGPRAGHGHWWVGRRDGRVEVEVRCSDFRHERTVSGLVVTLRDVTEQRRLEKELTRRAFHDALTGLPNRTLLLERTERALLRGRRESSLTCLLFIDLDDFKQVNDTKGHRAGDLLLVAVGNRLSGTLRRTDTAARLGGDEFAVLMEDARRPIDAELLAAQVIRTLGRPFDLAGTSVTVSASVGVATARDSTDAEELLGHADLALYAAKAAGKRQWRRFRPLLPRRTAGRNGALSRPDRALADPARALRYQPVVDITAGEVVGFEALVRHTAPSGSWVLQNAVSDIAGLQRLPGPGRPPYVSVNVSARQFRDAGFVEQVGRVLRTPGLEPGSLQLELTQTALLHHDDRLRPVLHTLKDLGVRIAVDDFGPGFSSLPRLRDLPVDVLKIDKSVIDGIARDSRQVALVEGIVRTADTLGLRVVADGIENAAQRDLLAGMGCRFGQGRLFARPLTVEQSARVLRRPGGGMPFAPPRTHRPRTDSARGRREARRADLERLRRTSPMSDAVLDEVRGRHIRSGDHWLIDFASCNYLGFDRDPDVLDAVDPAVRAWGTHPGWSRLLGSPRLYPDIEERLAALLGAPDALLLPTLTLIHSSVIPALAEDGHVFVEATAHRTIHDGAVVARAQGATLHRFHAGRLDDLRALLAGVPPGTPRLVCLDGVDSMSGNIPDLPGLAALCRAEGATLYVDDAHGFGVIGERGPGESCPYGMRGNCVVRHTGESYDGIVLAGGFSKAYSSLLAFLALPSELKNRLKTTAAPYLYSGPSPTASLATALAGLDVNERRGDVIRAELYRKTGRVLDHLDALGVRTLNRDRLPIVEVPLANPADLDAVAAFLWQEGVYVTLAAHPLVPRDRVGFRVQLTALNSDADIDHLNGTLTRLSERFPLRLKG